MTISYSLNEDDYITYQLYTASKSERVKKSRLRSKIIAPIALVILGLMYFSQGKVVMIILSFLFAALWFFLYPYREKHRYIRHYTKFVRETYQETFNKIVSCDFSGDHIYLKDDGNEGKLQLSELREINEIEKLILIRLKSGQTIILPKSKIEDVDALRVRLLEIASKLSIEYHKDLSWKWS